jgi:hypothetical protein
MNAKAPSNPSIAAVLRNGLACYEVYDLKVIRDREKRAKNQIGLNSELAAEAKAIVALAFRNGPIEEVHAGKPCPTCNGDAGYSHISDAEMKLIMKNAVDRAYSLLWMKQNKPIAYAASLEFARIYSSSWDDPILKLP